MWWRVIATSGMVSTRSREKARHNQPRAQAAVKIQKVFRGWLWGRKPAAEARKQKQVQAAGTIQRVYRGWKVRKAATEALRHVRVFFYLLFTVASDLVSDVSTRSLPSTEAAADRMKAKQRELNGTRKLQLMQYSLADKQPRNPHSALVVVMGHWCLAVQYGREGWKQWIIMFYELKKGEADALQRMLREVGGNTPPHLVEKYKRLKMLEWYSWLLQKRANEQRMSAEVQLIYPHNTTDPIEQARMSVRVSQALHIRYRRMAQAFAAGRGLPHAPVPTEPMEPSKRRARN